MDIVRETASTLAALQSPFFAKTDSIENISAWLEGLSLSEDKRKFLEWTLHILGQQVGLESGLVNIGLFSSQQDAKDFVDGKMSEEKDKKVWKTVFQLIINNSKFEVSKEDMMASFRQCEQFTDSLVERVSFSDQLTKPIQILDYQLEKAIGNSSKPSSTPSVKTLKSFLSKLENEKKNLEENSQSSNHQNNPSDGIGMLNLQEDLNKFSLESGGLKSLCQDFENKFSSNLKPVLRNTTAVKPVSSEEIVRLAEQSLGARSYLQGSQSTFNNINKINNMENNIKSTNLTLSASNSNESFLGV